MNLSSSMYLFFRLAPFIIVCSFVLQSFFVLDLRGPVYAAGIVISCLLAMFVAKTRPLSDEQRDHINPKCGIISIGDMNSSSTSMPLSMAIYGFTFFYLLVGIADNVFKQSRVDLVKTTTKKNDIANNESIGLILVSNLPIFIFFPLLIALEFIWINSNSCFGGINTLIALSIGASTGMLYGYLIKRTSPGLLYSNRGAGIDVCSRPSKTYFKCAAVKTT